MKHLFLSILSVLFMASYALSQAQTRTWKSPESIFTIDDGTELTNVEFSDTATLLSFRRTTSWGNDTIRVHSTTFIIDEQGKRHYALASYGIPMDEYVRWGNRAEWCYTLKFAPLPRNTKSIDVLIGPYSGNAQWYGVHEAGTDLNIPTPDTNVSQDELRKELMKKGKATIRGHVTNGKDYPVWPVWVLRSWDDMDDNAFSHKGKAVLIQENGDFEFSVDLQRPTFACLYLGYRTQLKPILLYLEPGKTVTLDVRDVYGQGAYLGYSSNQRFRKLLECYPAYLFSRTYPNRTEHTDGTTKLNNYLIHKYDLSPMEARILQGLGDMRRKLFRLYDVFYSNYDEDNTYYYSSEETKEKLWKETLEKLDKDDVTWLFSPFFAEFSDAVLPDMNPNHSIHCQTVSEMNTFVPEIDARLHQSFDTSESPFLLQELSLQQLADWFVNLFPLNDQDREEAISYLENHYTDPYVKGRVRGLLTKRDTLGYYERTYPMEESLNSTGVVERIYAPFKGKFLQIITLRNGKNEHIMPTIGNLLIQYANSPDVAFLFVSHGNEITDEDCVNRILNYFPYSKEPQAQGFLKDGYIHLSDAEYNELAVAFNCTTGDFDYATLNKEGKPLQQPLSMTCEINFSYALNQQLYGIYGDLPTEGVTETRNGVEIMDYEWNTLHALNYTLNTGRNIRRDVIMSDFGSPLIPNNNGQEARRYVYLTKQDKSQPIEFEITKHLQLPSNGTYRIDMLYSIDGDNLNGTLGGKPFTLNTEKCNAAMKKLTREQALEIPVLAPIASDPKETWERFKMWTNYWGWNYAQFTIHQDKGADTLDCTFRQDSKAVKELGDKAINWFCIIDLRITKLEQ